MNDDKPKTTPEESAGKIPLQRLVSQLFAVAYEDDGPSGICGQACSITNPWRKLYLFETEEKMREFVRKIEQTTGRLRGRIVGMYYPAPGSVGDISFISG